MNLIERIVKLEKAVAKLLARTFISYAKSTYTPTYLGLTTPGVTTYTTQAGFYTQIGRVVFFCGRVVWTAMTGTGTASVSIPLTSDATTNMRYFIGVYPTNVTFANGSIAGTIAPNSTCVISLRVSVPATPTTGVYTNTTNSLFIGAVDTGHTASAALTAIPTRGSR